MPASVLYPTASQEEIQNQATVHAKPQINEAYIKSIESSVASQPPTTYSSQEGTFSSPFAMTSAFANDFEYPGFSNFSTQEHDNNGLFDMFGHKEPSNGKTSIKTSNVLSSSAKDSLPIISSEKETSKFGFEFGPLSESIDDLELTTTDRAIKDKFLQAKFEIDVGNIPEANKILKEMMENEEIRYKQLSFLDNNGFLGEYAPTSESK